MSKVKTFKFIKECIRENVHPCIDSYDFESLEKRKVITNVKLIDIEEDGFDQTYTYTCFIPALNVNITIYSYN